MKEGCAGEAIVRICGRRCQDMGTHGDSRPKNRAVVPGAAAVQFHLLSDLDLAWHSRGPPTIFDFSLWARFGWQMSWARPHRRSVGWGARFQPLIELARTLERWKVAAGVTDAIGMWKRNFGVRNSRNTCAVASAYSRTPPTSRSTSKVPLVPIALHFI